MEDASDVVIDAFVCFPQKLCPSVKIRNIGDLLKFGLQGIRDAAKERFYSGNFAEMMGM